MSRHRPRTSGRSPSPDRAARSGTAAARGPHCSSVVDALPSGAQPESELPGPSLRRTRSRCCCTETLATTRRLSSRSIGDRSPWHCCEGAPRARRGGRAALSLSTGVDACGVIALVAPELESESESATVQSRASTLCHRDRHAARGAGEARGHHWSTRLPAPPALEQRTRRALIRRF